MHNVNKAECEVVNHISNNILYNVRIAFQIAHKKNYKGSLFTIKPIFERSSLTPQLIKLSPQRKQSRVKVA